MDHGRLAQANLNALVTLDALLATGSVTRSAEQLGVTVSAVSHTLRSLRATFDDPLLVRGRGGLTPTPRALALVGPLRQGLQTLALALADDPRFDPASSGRTFSVATTDYAGTVLAAELVRGLAELAPGLTLDMRPLADGELELALERGEVDVGVYPAFSRMGNLERRRLFDDGFSCLVRDGHPRVGKRLSLARFVELPHALISPQGSGTSIVDRLLAERGLSRRISFRVRSFLTAPLVVAESDLILTAPTLLARAFARHGGLRVLAPPIEIPRFTSYLYWHERFDHDPAQRWLRERVVEAAASVVS